MIATREQLLLELGHNAIYFNDAPTPLLAAHVEKVRRELAQNTTTSRIIVSSARAKSPKPAPAASPKPAAKPARPAPKPAPPKPAAKKLDPLEAEIEKRAKKYSHLSRAAALRAVAKEFEAEIKTLRKTTPAPKVKAMSDYPTHLNTDRASDDATLDEAIEALRKIVRDPGADEDERERAKKMLEAIGEDVEKEEARRRGDAVAINEGTRLRCYNPRRSTTPDDIMQSLKERYYQGGR